MNRRGLKIALGTLIWLGAAIWLYGLARAEAERLAAPLAKIKRYATSPPREFDQELPGPLAVGDPVLSPTGERIGAVVAIHSGAVRKTWDESLPSAPTYSVRVAIDPEGAHLLPAGDFHLEAGTTPMDGVWVMETLLPPKKRELISKALEGFLRKHEQDLAAFVRPIAEDVVAEGMRVMEANLSDAMSKQEKAIHVLLDDHREKLRKEVVPVLKRELGPSAKEKADPILREIGRELWDELPIWSLGWRAFVDTIPGTKKDRVDKWWKTFVDDKAIPILAKHEPQLMGALEELIEEGAKNPKVRASMAKATRRLAKDPRFRALVRKVLEDSLIRPLQWRRLMTDLIKKPAHARRLKRLIRLFQPTLQRLGHELTIDAETGALDPDLVRVLRRVVFFKDSRWVRVVADTQTP